MDVSCWQGNGPNERRQLSHHRIRLSRDSTISFSDHREPETQNEGHADSIDLDARIRGVDYAHTLTGGGKNVTFASCSSLFRSSSRPNALHV
jgi:hypothetical protein